MDEPKNNPIEQAMEMAMQAQHAQFNMAKLKISWHQFEHTFEVESMNPVSAFELMNKVKEVARKELGKRTLAEKMKPVK